MARALDPLGDEVFRIELECRAWPLHEKIPAQLSMTDSRARRYCMSMSDSGTGRAAREKVRTHQVSCTRASRRGSRTSAVCALVLIAACS